MYYIKYLDMFRAILCSSSGGQNCIFTASVIVTRPCSAPVESGLKFCSGMGGGLPRCDTRTCCFADCWCPLWPRWGLQYIQIVSDIFLSARRVVCFPWSSPNVVCIVDGRQSCSVLHTVCASIHKIVPCFCGGQK
jgi:hypothetical protein